MTSYCDAPHILCIGLSHQSASIEQREALAVLASEQGVAGLQNLTAVTECALLSTCNRLEWYFVVNDDPTRSGQSIRDRLTELSGISGNHFDAILSMKVDCEAVVHLFEVASGLDSMVVGESEILGQVSRAYAHAIEENSIGPTLDALFRAAIRCGRRVRSETTLGNNSASLSSVALHAAAGVLGDLSQRNILVIGLGKMGSLACKLLRAQGAENVVLMNRTFERARVMAGPDWSALPMEELATALAAADCVLSATSAPQTIITSEHVAQASALRMPDTRDSTHTDPWVFIDLALPRDIEPGVGKSGGVTLYDLDALQESVDSALRQREAAIPDAIRIVNSEEEAFRAKLRELEVRPLVVELRLRAEAIREQELDRTLRRLGNVEPDTISHLQHLTHALVNKLLHNPTVRMKEMAHEDRQEEVLTTVCDLFGLNGSASSH